MKSTADEPKMLESVIVDVITGKTELDPDGIDFDTLLPVVQDELGKDKVEPAKVFAALMRLVQEDLVVKREPGNGGGSTILYQVRDLDVLAESLNITDLIDSL